MILLALCLDARIWFLLTRPYGRDHPLRIFHSHNSSFLLTRPYGRDLTMFILDDGLLAFLLTRPYGRDHDAVDAVAASIKVSTHTPIRA